MSILSYDTRTLNFLDEKQRSFKHPLLSGSNSRGLHADLLEELKDFAQNGGAKKKNRQQEVQVRKSNVTVTIGWSNHFLNLSRDFFMAFHCQILI